MRYVATIELNVYGTESEAVKEAMDICNEINDRLDARADLSELHESPTGTLAVKKVDPDKLRELKLKLKS